MSEGKIIRPNFGDPKLQLDRYGGSSCAHEFVAVRIRSRTVICRICEEPVDSFDVLQKMALHWERATYFQAELDKISDRTEELKREEANIKARIRAGYRSAENPKAALYFEEYMRRLNTVESYGDSHELGRWDAAFHWLTPEQEAAIKEATIRANRRIEDTARKARKRGRHVKVLEGGG